MGERVKGVFVPERERSKRERERHRERETERETQDTRQAKNRKRIHERQARTGRERESGSQVTEERQDKTKIQLYEVWTTNQERGYFEIVSFVYASCLEIQHDTKVSTKCFLSCSGQAQVSANLVNKKSSL